MSSLSGRSKSAHELVLAVLIGVCAQTSPSQTNPFEAVPESPQPPPRKVTEPTIQAIEFRGAIRFPESVLRALMVSHVGGAYDVETLRRDSRTLHNTGRYSDIAWETEEGKAGVIVHFTVVERSLIQSIEYQGDSSVTVPEILERFKQRKIKLRTDTLLDEDELARAAAAVRELVLERGGRSVAATPFVEPIGPPLTVRIIFKVEEIR